MLDSADDSRFTFNIGRHDERDEDVQTRRWTKFPPAATCNTGCHRIGRFAERGDLWWHVTEEADLEAIGLEIKQLLETAVLPYLDGTRSVTGR